MLGEALQPDRRQKGLDRRQVASIGFGSWPPLQAFCFTLGLVITVLGVRNRREARSAGES